MASLITLPTEILQKITANISEQPFETRFLLINKALCGFFMAEQVRILKLTARQVDRFITTITNNDMKGSYSIPQYCNFLDKIYELDIRINNQSAEMMAGFISRCTSLRRLAIEAGEGVITRNTLQWNISTIIGVLSLNIIEMHFKRINFGEGDEGIRSIAEYMKRNTKLATLQLQYTSIKEARILGECLEQNLILTKLNLFGNYIHAEGAGALAEGLKQNTALTNLDLVSNSIGDKGAYALAEGLKQNTALINMDLGHNGIGDKGAQALAEGLKLNTALTSLKLGDNTIGSEGARALANCLKQNTVLTNLNLKYNRIGDEGTRALAESLKMNIALTNLNLSNNGIGDDGARALAESLKLNTVLTNLNLDGYNVGFDGHDLYN